MKLAVERAWKKRQSMYCPFILLTIISFWAHVHTQFFVAGYQCYDCVKGC